MSGCELDILRQVRFTRLRSTMPRTRLLIEHLCLLLIILLFNGCSGTPRVPDLRPKVDLSPVGCGYKWFQSGYGPTLEMPCDEDRSPLRSEQIALAIDHAWETARTRCPQDCPPRELEDSVPAEDRFPNGVCSNGYAYFTTRVFFQCGL